MVELVEGTDLRRYLGFAAGLKGVGTRLKQAEEPLRSAH